MNQPAAPLHPREIPGLLRKFFWLWTLPALGIAAAAGTYAAISPESWKATQALVVRDEVAGNLSGQGRFDSTDALKAAQETVLEVARNQEVVARALRAVGPPADCDHSHRWPTQRDVLDACSQIRVSAPQGVEFGQTDVLHLSVEAQSRQRAVALASAVCDQLEARLRALRDHKAQSVLDELQKAVELARVDFDQSNRSLEAMERAVGDDLGELRVLNDSSNGESNLRAALNQIDADLREARARDDAVRQRLELLTDAKRDPEHLLAMPNDLLDAQPALRRLKDGLVDAQLRSAELLGRMSRNHPLAQAALTAESQVKQHLHDELTVAVRGLEADRQVSAARVAALEEQARQVTERLDRLAGLRARYGNLVAEADQRRQMLHDAERALADARARQSAAHAASLLTRVDSPLTGDRPEGPGRATIAAAGVAGGLLVGWGLVFLVAPIRARWERRSNGSIPFGRRAGDPPVGRRATDARFGRRAADRDASPPVQQPPGGAGGKPLGESAESAAEAVLSEAAELSSEIAARTGSAAETSTERPPELAVWSRRRGTDQ